MKDWPLNLILIIFAAILQTTIMHYFSIKFGIANIILCVFVILLFFKYRKIALLWVVVGGIILDLLSSSPAGLYFFGFLIIYLAIAQFLKNTDLEEILALLVSEVLASLVFDIFFLIYLRIWGQIIPINIFLNLAIFDGILNIILTIFIYLLVIFFQKRFSRRRKNQIFLASYIK